MIEDSIHKLKSSAGYSGASHIHYACYFMQEFYLKGEYDKMMDYYPTLIESVITFRIYMRQVLAKKEGSVYEI